MGQNGRRQYEPMGPHRHLDFKLRLSRMLPGQHRQAVRMVPRQACNGYSNRLAVAAGGYCQTGIVVADQELTVGLDLLSFPVTCLLCPDSTIAFSHICSCAF